VERAEPTLFNLKKCAATPTWARFALPTLLLLVIASDSEAIQAALQFWIASSRSLSRRARRTRVRRRRESRSVL
jgi:hypothetical protein